MDKKCIFIGTSNSIVRGGIFDGFRDNFNGSVDRVALGGAPFSQFLGSVSEDLLKNYQYALIDTSPNDESYGSSLGSELLFEKLYEDFIRQVSSYCKTFVIRVPTSDNIGKETRISAIHRRICDQLGTTYIDLSSYVRDEARVGSEQLFRDKYHPATDIMNRIGHRLAILIETSPRDEYMKSNNHWNYTHIEALGTEENHLVTNSLLSESFCVLKADGTIKLPKFMLCLGMFIYAGRSSASVRLNGLNCYRDLSCYFDTQTDNGRVLFIPFTDGMLINSISVIKPWHSACYALHSKIPSPPYELSISKFLCVAD